jgi:hypothetical protein
VERSGGLAVNAHVHVRVLSHCRCLLRRQAWCCYPGMFRRWWVEPTLESGGKVLAGWYIEMRSCCLVSVGGAGAVERAIARHHPPGLEGSIRTNAEAAMSLAPIGRPPLRRDESDCVQIALPATKEWLLGKHSRDGLLQHTSVMVARYQTDNQECVVCRPTSCNHPS